ncbi:MAG: SLC13 family permease, partial [Planctomycetaceae bacterium]|nr:SLC13 family permease [Planctomycetaceae bacterium]
MATFAIILTLSVVVAAIVGIMYLRFPADISLLAGLTILLIHGAFDPDHGLSVERGLSGFSNPGVLTVAVLFVVADGLQRTGAFAWLGMRLLGTPAGTVSAQLRTMIPAAALSAFLNNTPVVALMMPIISDWSRKHRISVSHLFLPLSYATILGGMCTLIGTSTTVVVNSKLEEKLGVGLSMFELSWVGIPSAILGIGFLALFTRRILPERQPAFTANDDPREYTVEMEVDPSSPLVGKTIEEAGLRHLPGMYLMEIDRSGHVLAAVSSETLLEANDHLVFVGVVESVVDLQKIPGLKPATDQLFKLDGPRAQRCLIEAVVSSSYPFLKMTVRESRFRAHYNAAIIAVHRNGERLSGRIGDITLLPGDTLLLESTAAFLEQQRNSRHFYLVSEVQNSAPVQHEHAWIARVIMLAFIVAASVFASMRISNAALLASLPAAMLMILFRCTRTADARRAIDWNVILVMAAGLGLGEAMHASRTDVFVTNAMSHLVSGGRYPMLIAIYTL